MPRTSSTYAWQRRCNQRPAVKTLAAIALCASGCFYVDPINQRPSADIIDGTSGTVHRGQPMTLTAETYDPEGQVIALHWRVYSCTDATTPSGCDADPYYEGSKQVASFNVSVFRADNTTPTAALRVILEAIDDHGATARPSQELLLSVDDALPTVTLRKSSAHNFVVGTPVDVYASVDDPDDGPSMLGVTWMLYSPATQPAFTDTDLGTVPGDAATSHHQLISQGTGDFNFEVTATDPMGAKATNNITVTFGPDTAPCIDQLTPMVAPPGNTEPLQDPTLFQVLVVDDDLDPYPTRVTDQYYGPTQFSWSLLPPGATTRQPLSVVGNSVAIDPANYTPGDVLELRVEIQDRVPRTLQCPDTDPTCEVVSGSGCFQRMTWKVQVQ